jgi:cyclopropane-fatty-acyl-phospholipid synthase
LTLWMGAHYPNATITAVSNSQSQRAHIMGEAKAKGLANVTVVTADMNAFATDQKFDRIVSVEMFEHMANWRALLERTRGWLKPDGFLFLHVFTHVNAPYRFDHRDKEDWIAQHFFTGGIMPSRTLINEFPDLYSVADSWDWNGTHYARTARDWLANCDANRPAIERLFSDVYGDQAKLWLRRWRLFYLATEGLFGDDAGRTWGVSHYRLRPTVS